MERGLYKRTSFVVNSTCLGNETVKDVMEIYNEFYYGKKDFLKIAQLVFEVRHEQ